MNILIVEDNDGFRNSLRNLVELASPCHRISEAATGEAAVAAAQATPPDLVIMDIGLPGINGIEATRLIKQALPETSVVMLSVHENEFYRAKAAAAGAASYVPKSRVYNELLPVLLALLDSHSPVPFEEA